MPMVPLAPCSSMEGSVSEMSVHGLKLSRRRRVLTGWGAPAAGVPLPAHLAGQALRSLARHDVAFCGGRERRRRGPQSANGHPNCALRPCPPVVATQPQGTASLERGKSRLKWRVLARLAGNNDGRLALLTCFRGLHAREARRSAAELRRGRAKGARLASLFLPAFEGLLKPAISGADLLERFWRISGKGGRAEKTQEEEWSPSRRRDELSERLLSGSGASPIIRGGKGRQVGWEGGGMPRERQRVPGALRLASLG